MSIDDSIAELEQDAAAAAEKLAKAKEAIRQAEREAEALRAKAVAEKERARIFTCKAEILNPIIAEFSERGIPCSPFVHDQLAAGFFCGGDSNTEIHVEEQFENASSWRRRPTGKFIVTVGARFSSQPVLRYPQRADGTYNIAKIAASVKERLQAAAAQKAAAAAKELAAKAATGLAAHLCQELGVKDDKICGKHTTTYHDYKGRRIFHEYVAPEGHVYFKVGTPLLNEAQARVMAEALTKIAALTAKKEV